MTQPPQTPEPDTQPQTEAPEHVAHQSEAVQQPRPGAIDLKEIAIGDLLVGMMRLKLSSALFLIAALIAIISGTITLTTYFLEPLQSSPDKQMTQEQFSLQFIDHRVLSTLTEAFLAEKPDGVNTYEEAMSILIWQVKSQNGFCEMLSGDRRVAVQLRFIEDATEFDWVHEQSAMNSILKNIDVEATPETIAQLNAELNFLSVAWVNADHHIVRDLDGSLSVIGQE